MRNIYLLFTFIFLSYEGLAQLYISQNGTVAQWVQNNLVGPGITVSNVTYTGSTQSIGLFSSGLNTGNMGISSGLVISTGNVTDLPGYGNAFASTNTYGGSDPLLAQLITQSINDAAVLEFDFVPVSDTLKFRYVFGSEEYPEFVNSINDVFGFFVSGLSPYGGMYNNVNVALIPNTTTPITINNVNQSVNSNYYVDNSFGSYVKLDGFTTVLTAWLKVFPCLTYHIKIAIGDAQDHIYDSGVFFEANSFMSSTIVVNQSTSNIIDTAAVEGCNDAVITFKIPQPKTIPTNINFIVSGTATNGVDYTQLPNFVTIPAGQDSVVLNIHPIIDNLPEPTEFVDLIVGVSACTYDTISVSIKDNTPPIASLSNDTIICGSGIVDITSNAIGGYAPYTYIWNTGDTTSSISVSPLVTTTYTLMVSDLCTNDSIDSVIVTVSEPIYKIHNDTICKGDTALLFITDSMNNSYQWLNGGPNTDFYNVSPNSSQSYSFTATDTFGCSTNDVALAVVNPLPIIETSNDTIICLGGIAKLKAYGSYDFYWSTGANQSAINVSPTSDSTFYLLVIDSNLCKNYSQVNVDVLPIPIAEIIPSTDSICIGNVASLSAMGGDQYLWSTGSSSQEISVNPTASTIYSVTVTNLSGETACSDKASYTLNVKKCNFFHFASAFTPNGDGLNDYFGISGEYGAIEYCKIYIYDRWGELVFHSEDPYKKWDGRYKGQQAPEGVYVYIVFVKEKLIEPYELKGTIHLNR